MYSLSSASAATGVNRTTIWRCIKGGKLSAQRDANGGWQIEPAELHWVFPPLPTAATVLQGNVHQGAMTDAMVAELRSVIADLRSDRDHWRSLAEQQQQQQQCLLAIAQHHGARPYEPDVAAQPDATPEPATPWRRFLRWRKTA
jgi:hypothetical protein